MRRGQQSGKLFRGSELPRLVAMIAFTGVLGVTYVRAKDPSMWRWIARSDEPALTVGALAQLDRTPTPGVPASVAPDAVAEPDSIAKPEPPAESDASASTAQESAADNTTPSASSSAAQPTAAQPNAAQPTEVQPPAGSPKRTIQKTLLTDEDPDEIEAAREEYQAISDKEFLRPEEMPIYWRMIGWQQRQSFEQLEKRSRNDLMFAHLFDRPDDHRGQILRLKLRLVRSLSYVEENTLGIERLYEAWGATEESYPEPYCIVLAGLPQDFPIGHDIEEEVTFCGYFVKVMAYRSRDDKLRASPLLVGKLLWHKRASAGTDLGDSNWVWILLVGGVIFALAAVRFGLSLLPRRTRVVRPLQLDNLPEDAVPIEDWLDQATEEADAEPEPEKNDPGFENREGPNNGGPTPRLYNGDRFWRYEGRES